MPLIFKFSNPAHTRFILQMQIFDNIDYKGSFTSKARVTHFVESIGVQNRLIEKILIEELDKSGENTGDFLSIRATDGLFEDYLNLFVGWE